MTDAVTAWQVLDVADRNQTNSIVPDLSAPDFPDLCVPGLIVICGTTASGKSGLGIAIAQRLNAMGLQSCVISADSRQVYREFSIGTAKVMPEEMQGVPHYLVDAYDPTETVSVAMFQDQVNDILRQPIGIPLLVGGTGLYIRSITHGMRIPRVAQNRDLRNQLESLGQSVCHQILQQVDPIAALKIHANDRIRTVRALEVFYVTGIPMSTQQGEDPPTYPVLQIGLHSDQLDDRIIRRTGQMFGMGFVEEVKDLVAKYGDRLPLLETLGYQEVHRFLRDEITLEEAEELTVLHTRQFAKRQRTWFNGIPEIEWFNADADDLVDRVWQRVLGFV
jgi:tRNA dimethylallyltransferase